MILFGDNGRDRADGYIFEHLADMIDPEGADDDH